MKSIFRYPGGKSKISIRSFIHQHSPKIYTEYREPMVGGGGIFFSIPPHINRWINDINPNLMSVYQILKNNPKEFIKQCKSIKPPQNNEPLSAAKGGKALYNARLKQKFDELIKNKENHPALSYFFINRTVWGGRVTYEFDSRLYFSNPNGWNIVNTTTLQDAAKLLENTKITCGNYKKMLEPQKKPHKNPKEIWVYLDPPYVVNSKLHKSSQLYEYNFGMDEHEEMAELIKKSPYSISVSYDDDDQGLIRSLYKDFNIHEAEWTYCGTSSSADSGNKKKKKGKELIITNYETNECLFNL